MDLRKEFNEMKENSKKNRPIADDNKNYDKILIRLHRQYSRDEVILASQKRLSEVWVELGKWKAYADELEEYISKMKITKAEFKNIVTTTSNEQVKKIRQKFNDIKRENIELKKFNAKLLIDIGRLEIKDN